MSRIDRKVCVVRGCGRRQAPGGKSVGHQFPKTKGRGSLWIECCANEDLCQLSLAEIISLHLFICTDHFTSNCFYFTQHEQRRLSSNALPTLNLPEKMSNTSDSAIAGMIDLPNKENLSSSTNVSPIFDSTVGKISCNEKLASPGIRKSALYSSTLSPLKCRKKLAQIFEETNLDVFSKKQVLPEDCTNNVLQDYNVQVMSAEKGGEIGPEEKHSSTQDCGVHVVSMEIDEKADPRRLKGIKRPGDENGHYMVVADDMLAESDSHKQKGKNPEADKNSRKGNRVEDKEKNVEPNRKKSAKCHHLMIRPNNRSIFSLYELTTPLERRIYFQLQKEREQNAANKKKIIRYLNLMKKCSCRKKEKV